MSEKTVEQLAEEHAEWFAELMIRILRPVIKETARTFLEHGYKHGKEKRPK